MSAKLGMRTVDIGTPQLSMHSIREMCCTSGVSQACKLYKVRREGGRRGGGEGGREGGREGGGEGGREGGRRGGREGGRRGGRREMCCTSGISQASKLTR